jgi:preprotein translocase subunit SecF
MRLMRFKYWFFGVSIFAMIPGLVFIFLGGLKPGIDFTGGNLLEYKFESQVQQEQLSSFGEAYSSGANTWIIKTKTLDDVSLMNLKNEIQTKVGNYEILREENVGPIIGKELEQNAIKAVIVSSVMIVIFITLSFRKVPKPASSFRFGVSAIIALLHDVLLIVGLFAILGYFWGVEINSMFITALLTIMGFSIHDTIVVFDRIRENLLKHAGEKFESVVDVSIEQTLVRSLNTSLTVLFVLLAILLFGGESIRWFVVALLAGVISGTYSSIFNAAAVLTWWEERLGH